MNNVELIAKLQEIAEKLDYAKELHEGGFIEAHGAAAQARLKLHWLIKSIAAVTA